MNHSRTAAAAATAPHRELADRFRPEFPIFERKVYLNSNSLGALSERSVRLRRTFEEQWHELGASAWYELWLDRLEEVRSGFGRTVGADSSDVALTANISTGLTAVAGALDFEKRPKVVLTDLDFPTVAYQFLSRERQGIEVEVVESPDGATVPPGRIAAAVDERTALLATSHVFFTSGAIQDVPGLAEIAHDAGALLLVDAYQSNGQLPIDVEAWDVDFLLSGSLKWLCGGPGLAFLYVRRKLADRLEPTTLGWFGVADPFAFDLRGADLLPGARRFEQGTPAVGAAFTAAGGLEIIREAGLDRIRERVAGLAGDLVDRLRVAGFTDLKMARDPAARSAIVLVRHPSAREAVEALAAEGIIVDSRAGCVRISPHFYNTVEDNRAFVDALEGTGGAS